MTPGRCCLVVRGWTELAGLHRTRCAVVTPAGSAGRAHGLVNVCPLRPLHGHGVLPEFPEHGRGRASQARASQGWGPSAGSPSRGRWPRCQPRQLGGTSDLDKQLREPVAPWGGGQGCGSQLSAVHAKGALRLCPPHFQIPGPGGPRPGASSPGLLFSCRTSRGPARRRPASRPGRSFLASLEVSQPRLSPGWQQRTPPAGTEGRCVARWHSDRRTVFRSSK